jgi:hypothetical protein
MEPRDRFLLAAPAVKRGRDTCADIDFHFPPPEDLAASELSS